MSATFSAEISARVSSIFTCDWSKENGSRETSGKVTDLCPGFHGPDVSSAIREPRTATGSFFFPLTLFDTIASVFHGKSPDIKARVFQSKASSRNSATKGTVNFRLTLSVIKLCQGSCAFISMLSSMEVVSKLQRTRRD